MTLTKNVAVLSILLVGIAIAQPIIFTGDVEADFTNGLTITTVDPHGADVGMPPVYPVGTISGNDIKDVRLLYDSIADILYVGINTYTIAGDVDDNGDPANSGAILIASGGVDLADFSETESFCFYLDLDLDGTYDVIAGVSGSADISSFSVSEFSGSPTLPQYSFGTNLPAHLGPLFASPSASQPDLEFTILGFSTLPTSSGINANIEIFNFTSFIGSSQDDGIGEDFVSGSYGPKDMDFGDSPDPAYPTLLSSNGARHIIVSGMYLGSSVDADADGQQSPSGLGDDNDGNDDDDGAFFPNIPLDQLSEGYVRITASASGYINAWMDFNQDGDWDDADEQIIVDEPVTAGLNWVTFNIPLIDDGQPLLHVTGIMSRIRFSSQTGLAPTGLAPDGEVEDYLVDVLVPVELSSFTANYRYGKIHLKWVTQSETGNLGFYVYRSDSQNGEYSKVSTQLIPGAGNSESTNHYSFVDNTIADGTTYFYRLADVSHEGFEKSHSEIKVQIELPSAYTLDQNYPNPFNPETNIPFKLKETGQVHLTVYNMTGQLVRTLADVYYETGSYEVTWDGRDDIGTPLPSGLYLYNLRINGHSFTKKMSLMK
jgi:hypothetical protein